VSIGDPCLQCGGLPCACGHYVTRYPAPPASQVPPADFTFNINGRTPDADAIVAAIDRLTEAVVALVRAVEK